jgi:formylmethanofuran dehydrogenase subunit E
MPEGQSKWKQKFYDDVEKIRLKDPLAVFLGAMDEEEVFVFSYADAVKLAGHSCPAVSGAYKITAKALKALYGNDLPVRGEIRVAVLGTPEDGANGPMSQVISFVTGAAAETGFGGLGGARFRRRNMLVFDIEKDEFGSFIFQRIDNGRTVKVTYNMGLLPADERMGELYSRAMSDEATKEEKEEFVRVWQDRVRKVLLEEIDGLFSVRRIEEYKFPGNKE